MEYLDVRPPQLRKYLKKLEMPSIHASLLGLLSEESSGRKKEPICTSTTAHVCFPTVLHQPYKNRIFTCSTGISAKEYLESVAQREIDWIKTHADHKEEVQNPWLYTSKEQNSSDAHISALHKFISAVPEIVPKDLQLVSPRFWHPDFHAGNVYVDDRGNLSSIIDWQASWITPLFIGPNPPSLLDYGVKMMMELPDGYERLDQATKEQLRYQDSQSNLIHAYESRTAAENPLMYKMIRHLHGKTLKHLEAFAGATWDNCLFSLTECLIRVEK